MANLAVPEDVSRALAAEVKDRRNKAGLSQVEMAKRVGFRWATSYQRLEDNESEMNANQLTAIANVLGVYPDEIMRAARIRASAGLFPPRRGVGGAFGI